MKKVALFALLTGAIFVSCSDDDSTAVNTASVDGTWNLTSVTSAQPLDGNMDGTASTNFMAETGCFNNSNIIFGEDNTALLNLEVPFFTTCIEATRTATYVQNGNAVTFTVQDEEEGELVETMTLSGNNLTTETTYEIEIETGTGTQTVAYDITMVYTKQ